MVIKLLGQLLLIAMAIVASIFASGTDKPTTIGVLAALVAMSGVVVTVFGIWAAIIFPRLLGNLGSGQKPESVPEQARFDALVSALYSCAFVLCACVFVLILTAFYEQALWLFNPAVACFSWLCFFSVWKSLWRALVHGELAANHGINQSRAAGLLPRLRSRGKVVNQ